MAGIKAHQEKRAQLRLPIIDATVRYLLHGIDKSEFSNPYPIVDLSMTGMAFLTDSPIKPGKKISLLASFLEPKELLRLEGRVIYALAVNMAGHKYRLGIRFQEFSAKRGCNPPQALEDLVQVMKVAAPRAAKAAGTAFITTIKVGGNVFFADRDFTIVGIDNSNRPVVCGSGKPPTTRVLWITFRQNGAYLNADLAEVNGETVLQIKDNVITLNKNNIYTLIQLPENQIPPDRVLVINQSAEIIMVLQRDGDVWNFKGNFYHKNWHIVAAPKGTITVYPENWTSS